MTASAQFDVGKFDDSLFDTYTKENAEAIILSDDIEKKPYVTITEIISMVDKTMESFVYIKILSETVKSIDENRFSVSKSTIEIIPIDDNVNKDSEISLNDTVTMKSIIIRHGNGSDKIYSALEDEPDVLVAGNDKTKILEAKKEKPTIYRASYLIELG